MAAQASMEPGQRQAHQAGRSNLRTALVLFSIALVFFVGVIVNRMLFLD